MSDSDISPFILSVKRTEVRYSLLAAFPWTVFEYPNLNSRIPNILYAGYDLEVVTTAMADHHEYTGSDREEYISHLMKAGAASKAQWDAVDPPPPGNFEEAIRRIMQASMHRQGDLLGHVTADYAAGNKQSWWHRLHHHHGVNGMSAVTAFALAASAVALALIYHLTR